MSARIAVVGSLNVDLTIRVGHLPAAGETVLATSPVKVAFGGKGGNQAAAAALLGAEVAMIGRVGSDEHGSRIRQDLARRGIDITGTLVTPGVSSGTATIPVDPHGSNLIIVDPGANGLLSPADVELTSVRDADTVLLQLEVPVQAVAAAAKTAAGRVILNPAPAADIGSEVLSRVDVLVPNAVELGLLAGASTPRTAAEAVRLARKLALGADVVVTLGGDGAVAVPHSGAGIVHVLAPVVPVLDTTGAGDCFCGVLAVSLSAGLDLAEAVRRAVAAAAISTTAAGARAGFPAPADVEAAADRIAVLPVGPD